MMMCLIRSSEAVREGKTGQHRSGQETQREERMVKSSHPPGMSGLFGASGVSIWSEQGNPLW